MSRLAALLLVASLAAGCRSGPTETEGSGAATASALAAAPASASGNEVKPAALPSAGARGIERSNPLGLPPRKLTLDPGRRVFTFSDAMLRGARLGSTLVLYAATVTAFDGDDLIVEGLAGPSYRVHAGYVIAVPDRPKLRLGDPILTEWNGTMKHAVVTRFVKDRTVVRYTDVEARAAEGQLKNARIIKQVNGLAPGNYAAALGEGGEYKHVLLVSPVEAEPRSWFALGFGGAAMLVAESALRPIPVTFSPKVGAAVWAEWVGTMRPATVQTVEAPASFTVKFERAGRPVQVGWGLLMAPLGG